MLTYIARRLLLLPVTLFAIVLVNFGIINLAPGDPVNVIEMNQEGNATLKTDKALAFGSDERYLHFREHYGLTLPIFWNHWPWTTEEQVEGWIRQLVEEAPSYSQSHKTLSVKEYDTLRIYVGDRSRFMMPQIIAVMHNPSLPTTYKQMAIRFFVRGASREVFLGVKLTPEQEAFNQKIAEDDLMLSTFLLKNGASEEEATKKVEEATAWYQKNAHFYNFSPTEREKWGQFLFETRFYRYISRVLTLNFGTLRNDRNKTVTAEVAKRLKYSLTLAIFPMIATFFFCQFFACIMALNQGKWLDHLLNFLFLFLYAVPVFVVVPFLIENLGMKHFFPFTEVRIPVSGFTSPEAIYDKLNTFQRLCDTLSHLFLPLLAVMYGSIAVQTRLSRTAILEVMRQDYIRTAWAKGASLPSIMIKHVGRNSAITIITSLAGSLGAILGGSLIVETLFEINGFGKFFYEAVLNRDYNVIMFSAFAGSFLSLVGYLAADVAYTILDPRVSLE